MGIVNDVANYANKIRNEIWLNIVARSFLGDVIKRMMLELTINKRSKQQNALEFELKQTFFFYITHF